MPPGFIKRAATKAVEAAAGERAAERCPRCESRDTKFCYYNNYNTAQPRHFCRSCRRYWTLGGSLRNVPIGGSSRKRPRPSSPPSNALAKSQRALPGLLLPVSSVGLAHSGIGPFISSSLPSGFLPLGGQAFLEVRAGFDLGLGLGLGLGSGPENSSSMEDIGFGLSSALSWPPSLLDEEEPLGVWETWRVESGGGCLVPAAAGAWPDLAVASPTGGLGAPASGLY